ncbi:DUF6691 family protein [Candidatus Puniceispirillum marinum]|nr:DUF6691 family protein [Candidatus Puniceispirillum marinum]
MPLLLSFVIGGLFGIGLAIAGMLNPSKIAGFLDIFGLWDPSLAFVMGGGVIVNLIGHQLLMKRATPLFGGSFRLPTAQDIDRRLLAGSALFGIGWGLGGLCPGPVISSLLLRPADVVLFAVMMMAGLWLGKVIR